MAVHDPNMAELRRFDHDRYLTALFAPSQRRRHLVALYAFNLEIAKTAEVVQEPMLGRIRLQWWREAVAQITENKAGRHAVVEALAAAVADCGLDEGDLHALIDAREFDLEKRAPRDLQELEGYAEASSAGLVRLALAVLGCRSPEGRVVGDAVGLTWALTGLLRAVPFHAGQRRLYLPADLTTAAGVTPAEIFARKSTPALRHVVATVAARAEDHLRRARQARHAVPRHALAAVLPATLAAGYLATLKRAAYDPFAPAVQHQPPGRVWRLAVAAALGRF